LLNWVSLSPMDAPQALQLGDALSVSGLPDGATLQVEVVNYNPDHKWRHAGGAEDWVVSEAVA
jgi:hypothetical protein